jgi:pilus assembly protein CpaE
MKNIATVYILFNEAVKLQEFLDIFEEIEGAEVIGDADNPERAFSQISEHLPTMVLVEISDDYETNIPLIEKVHNLFPKITILAFGGDLDSDTVIQAVHAGVQYFIREPLDIARINELVERTLLDSKVEEEVRGEEGKVFTVFSNKGGLGKTTVATNLAVSLALHCKKSVALVDLDLQFGDISIFLDLHPTFTISDLVSRIRELDRELIQSSLVRHETGVQALTEPKMAEESDLITPDHVDKIMKMMKSLFDYVVIDTTHSFDDVMIEALEISDSILLISVLDLPTIRNTQRCLEIFKRLNFDEDKIKLVINRFMSEEEVDPGRFETALKFPVFWKIPNDYSTVINAINGGVPIQRLAPSSLISRNFNELASTLTGTYNEKKSNHRPSHLIKKVFSILTRSKNE